MSDPIHRYLARLAADPFERMAFEQDPAAAVRAARVSLSDLAMLNAAVTSPSQWSACVVCSDPGPDDFPGFPDDPPPDVSP